jgi:hypothetical protein
MMLGVRFADESLAKAEQRLAAGKPKRAFEELENAYYNYLQSDDPRKVLSRITEIAEQIAERGDESLAKRARLLAEGVETLSAEAEAAAREREEFPRREQRRTELILEGSDRKQRLYAAPRERVFSSILRALAELNYPITHSDHASGVVSFTTGISMRSWGGQNATAAVEAIDARTTRVVIGGKTAQSGNPFSGGAGTVYTFGELKSVAGKVFQRVEAILVDEGVDVQPAESEVQVEPQEESRDGFTAKLERLADLHARGALNDEEFSAAKAKLLG